RRGFPEQAVEPEPRCARVVHQLQHEFLHWRELLLVPDAAVVTLLEAGELRRRSDRVLERAEVVDEPKLGRLRTGPDLPLRDAVDLLGRHIAMEGDAAHEILVTVLDHDLDQLARLLRQLAIETELAGPPGRAHAVRRDPEVRQR